jgi:hypothetical protein
MKLYCKKDWHPLWKKGNYYEYHNATKETLYLDKIESYFIYVQSEENTYDLITNKSFLDMYFTDVKQMRKQKLEKIQNEIYE